MRLIYIILIFAFASCGEETSTASNEAPMENDLVESACDTNEPELESESESESNTEQDTEMINELVNGSENESESQMEEMTEANLPELVKPDGTYETVPLEKSSIVLTVIQNAANLSPEGNLARMIEMGEEACAQEDKPDILLYHEFPLTGYVYGERSSKLTQAITVPGPETDALGELARSCDAYVIFGAYAKDPIDWPGHILSLSTVIGRDGEILTKVWKQRNIKRFYDTFEITTTTVEAVRDRFRELYGAEKEFEVIRTEFGNLAISSVQLDPLVFSALAVRGAEIILRTSTLFFASDVAYTSLVNNVYSAMSNITDASEYGGQSIIVNPMGETMAQVESRISEGFASARIPIAAFRAGRRIPQLTTELTADVFKQYTPEIPMNHLDVPESQLPQNGEQMKTLFDQISRWLNL